ncbi:MAG: hypothetical protein P4L99_21630 [Chthoniobacter sp.]|nr:hypothetical protein [Chthoniobacter sp.]
MDYYLSINGGAKVKLDLSKVSKLTRTQVSFNSSWLGISVAQNFTDALPVPLGAKVELFLGSSGTRLFCGTAVEPTKEAAPEVQGAQILVEDIWRQFRRTPFLQESALWTATNVADELVGSASQLIPWVAAFLDGRAASMTSTICDFLIADQGAHPDVLPVAWVKGNIDGDMQMRPAFGDTMMCSEIVKRGIQFMRDGASWVDYSGALPAFNLRRAANMETVNLPFGGDGSGASGWKIQRSTEQQLRYVNIRMVAQAPLNGTNRRFAPPASLAPAGYAGPAEGGLNVLLDLNSLFGVAQAQGFAQDVWESSQNVGWLGTVEVTGVDIATRLHPGVKINQIGGDPDMASMNAVVNRTTDDLLTGKTVATVGPAMVLTVQALEQMMRNLMPPISPDQITEQGSGNNPGPSGGRADKNKSPGNGDGKLSGSALLVLRAMLDDAGAPIPKLITVQGTIIG